MDSTTAIVDRRRHDRRAGQPFFSPYQLSRHGRRSGGRRSDDASPAYVDRYDRHLLWCTVAVLILCALDAVFTLSLIAKGAVEVNAFMAILIEDNVSKFVSVKLALTSLAIIILVMHHNVRLRVGVRVWHVQYLILAGYLTLITYEIALLRVAYA